MKPIVSRLAKAAFALADTPYGRWHGPRLLIYHQVGTHLLREMEVPTDTFARQLDWLAEHGEIVDLDTALTSVTTARADCTFSLGFDDGYLDLFTTAYPLLVAASIPFTLYLTTRPVDTREALTPGGGAEPLRWEHVQEMMDSGLVTLGAHTHTHPDLRNLPADIIGAELDRCNELISSRTGIVAEHFAYPKGYWDAVADREVRQRYRTAVLGAGPPITPATDPYLLHRIPVQRTDGLVFFKRKMLTGMRWEERTRRSLRGYRGPPA